MDSCLLIDSFFFRFIRKAVKLIDLFEESGQENNIHVPEILADSA